MFLPEKAQLNREIQFGSYLNFLVQDRKNHAVFQSFTSDFECYQCYVQKVAPSMKMHFCSLYSFKITQKNLQVICELAQCHKNFYDRLH